MEQRHLDPGLWPGLITAFAQQDGACLFDRPDSTDASARIRVLTAWPRFRETLARCGEHQAALTDRARRAPEAEADSEWLPLKLGVIVYGDGEMELGGAPAQGEPGLQVNEYDWVLLRDLEADTLTLVIADSCPGHRRSAVEGLVGDIGAGAVSQPAPFRLTERFRPRQSRESYLRAVARVQAYIEAGDAYQVNYAQPFQATGQGHPIHAFNALHAASPSPCSVYLDTGWNRVLSLSPERFLRVRGDRVETRPIKGTRRRGRSSEEDDALKQELLHSAKDRAENLMIVDLLRNDLGRCCRTGSVRAEPLFTLETFANVHHLVSTVTGRLAGNLSPIDLLLSAFPGGSITGAPKRRAMEIIRELEPMPRGAYCGSFFHWTPGGGFDSTIMIRTLEWRDDTLRCWGGGGIVADSVPQAEYEESITKIRLLMDVLEAL